MKSITIDQEVIIDGKTYWLNADVDVYGEEVTSDELRPYWGSTVYETITTFTPESAQAFCVGLWDANDKELDLDPVFKEKAAQKAVQLAMEACDG